MAEDLDSLDTLQEDIGTTTYLLNAYGKGKYVDIEFGVTNSAGSESASFSAHKLVLSLWSPYFADRFYGKSRATENVIVFEDVSPKAFKTMLRYMYGGYHNFPRLVKDARELHEVALKFQVASLVERTRNVINQTKPDVSNVFDLIEVCDYMNNDPLKRKCLTLIAEKTSGVLKSYNIAEISPSRLQLILHSPTLSLECEYDLLKFVYAWGQNRSLTVPEFSSAREALENVLSNLNFLALSNQQFAEFHENHPEFLEEKEVISIFMNISKVGSTWPKPAWHSDQSEKRKYTGRDT